MATFTQSQINALRAEYSRINSIDPCGDTYPKMIKLLNALNQENLKKLATANIKFVSRLAANRVIRIANDV
jgi:hypothetical protein